MLHGGHTVLQSGHTMLDSGHTVLHSGHIMLQSGHTMLQCGHAISGTQSALIQLVLRALSAKIKGSGRDADP